MLKVGNWRIKLNKPSSFYEDKKTAVLLVLIQVHVLIVLDQPLGFLV